MKILSVKEMFEKLSEIKDSEEFDLEIFNLQMAAITYREIKNDNCLSDQCKQKLYIKILKKIDAVDKDK